MTLSRMYVSVTDPICGDEGRLSTAIQYSSFAS